MGSPFEPTNQIVAQAPASTSSYSKTTVVHNKLMQQHLTATKESLIRDMATQPLSDEQVLQNFRTMAAVQVKADNLKAEIRAGADMDAPFTDREVEDMRVIKKDNNLTELELADLYETNQSKINRTLNNLTR